jgi:hypothetical protein
MAGAGYRKYTIGAVLNAAQLDNFLQEQTVMVFASASARNTALTGVLAEGMQCYLNDTNIKAHYNGTAWVTTYAEWQAFTPSWTNLAIGNGTVDVAEYREVDGGTWINVVITFGSTTAVTGAIQLTYPGSVTCTGQPSLTGTAFDSTTSRWYLLGARRASDTAVVVQQNDPTLSGGSTGATAPFAWAVSDSLRLSIFVPGI